MRRRIPYRRDRKWKFILLLILAAAVAGIYSFVNSPYYPVLFYKKANVDDVIEETARRYNIDPAFVKAVIWQESRFNQNIVDSKGEIGLMQIRPEKGAVTDWKKEHNIAVPCPGVLFRPELNIEIGTWYLSRALHRWEGYKYQYELALSEYNAGRKGMKKWIPQHPDDEVTEKITISSTKEYVKSIMKRYRNYTEKRTAQ